MQSIQNIELEWAIVHTADSALDSPRLSDEQLVAAGINPGLIRLSVGIENVDDIIEDLKRGLN
jgi:O-acetylhomoserine (thiol)-lyase